LTGMVDVPDIVIMTGSPWRTLPGEILMHARAMHAATMVFMVTVYHPPVGGQALNIRPFSSIVGELP